MGITELHDVRWGHVTNDMMRDEDKHYVTLFMMARTNEVPENCEPDKCEGWRTYSWDELVEIDARSERRGDDVDDGGVTPLLFGPLRQLIREDPSRVREYMEKAR